MMRIKLLIKLYLILLVTLLLSQHVLADGHAVCGQVDNAADGTDSSWFDVILYYENDRGNSITSDVSSYDHRYCGDADAIPGHSWSIGDEIFAEVLDDGNGYIAGPVSVITTGGEPDIEPTMTLRHVITIHSPINTIYDDNYTVLNVSTDRLYNNTIWYSVDNGTNITLCNTCNETNITITDLDEGSHSVTVYVNDSSNNIRDYDITFTIDAIAECGDDVCRDNESCSICEADCGSCDEAEEVVEVEEYYYSSVPAKKPIILRRGYVEMIIWLENNLRDVEFSISKLNKDYIEMPIAHGYFMLETNDVVDISKMIINYKIERDWLLENDLTNDDIIIYVYDDGDWIKYDAKSYSDNGGSVIFEFEVNKVTKYVVGSEKIEKEEVIEDRKIEFKIEQLSKKGGLSVFNIFVIVVVISVIIFRRKIFKRVLSKNGGKNEKR